MTKKNLSFIILLVIGLNLQAQYPQVSLPGSEVRTITSLNVPGQEYKLEIMLPAGYANSNKKYPVVYLMDSQWDFPLVKCIYGEYFYDGFIPELILVGVTWGGNRPNPDSLRARDYTPTNEKRLMQSGGADKFLSFMKDELFPFIETNYRAKSTDRILMGCSLGGLFTMYTMFTHTDMFTGYAAASPAIGWDNEVLYKYEKQFAAKTPTRLYMTVGEVERGKPGFEKMVSFLTQRHYKNVSIGSRVLENTGHSGTKGETYSRGLQFIFQRPVNKLSPETLNKYVGKYKNAQGEIIDMKRENDQLVLAFSPSNKFSLYNAGENEFYSTAQFLNVHFNPDGFELEQYGGREVFLKTNAQSKTYADSINAWHAQRIAGVKAPDGWLNLVGLHWLSPGINTFGSGTSNKIVFPKGKIAGNAGYFEVNGNTVTLVAEPAAAITTQGKPVTRMVIFDSARAVKLESGTLSWTIIKREHKLGIRLRDLESELVKNFKGIERFPIDAGYRIQARFEPADALHTIRITNVLGQTTAQRSPGTLVFNLGGKENRLDVLEEGDEFFIVFGDATNGEETYGGGRFIYVQKPADGKNAIIDFNKAYNPPCVFTPYATCPLPPPQNRLSIAVYAGEKNYGHH